MKGGELGKTSQRKGSCRRLDLHAVQSRYGGVCTGKMGGGQSGKPLRRQQMLYTSSWITQGGKGRVEGFMAQKSCTAEAELSEKGGSGCEATQTGAVGAVWGCCV